MRWGNFELLYSVIILTDTLSPLIIPSNALVIARRVFSRATLREIVCLSNERDLHHTSIGAALRKFFKNAEGFGSDGNA